MNVAIAQRGIASPYESYIITAARGDLSFLALTKAIISVESNWIPTAFRAEPRLNDGSVGLMQVLLATARGALGTPSLTQAQLFDPQTNIQAGTAYLRSLTGQYTVVADVVSAYNAGHPLRLADGSYGNEAYVDEVLAYYSWFFINDPLIVGAGGCPPSSCPPSACPPSGCPPSSCPPSPAGPIGLGALILLAIVAALALVSHR